MTLRRSIPCLFIVLALVFALAACSSITSDQALDKVRNQELKSGKTVDQALTEKANMPLISDAGWTVREDAEGGFIVERVLKFSNMAEVAYTWKVSKKGEIRPETEKAVRLSSSLK